MKDIIKEYIVALRIPIESIADDVFRVKLVAKLGKKLESGGYDDKVLVFLWLGERSVFKYV